MKKDVLGYEIGKVFYNNGLYMFGGLTLLSAYLPADIIIQAINSSNKPQIGSIVAGTAIMSIPLLASGFFTFLQYAAHIGEKECVNEVKAHPEIYPMQNAERIVFKDQKGLEMLLNKTRESNIKEWGTVFNAHSEGQDAYIDSIKLPDNSNKYINYIGKNAFLARVDLNKIYEDGYNGLMHFHPNKFPLWLGSSNFTIHKGDRAKVPWIWKDNEKLPYDMIQLLSFNHIRKGKLEPIVIGFNLQNTYIPADESNNILIKAGPKEIREYLEK